VRLERIEPTPTDDEAAAIVAALEIVMAEQQEAAGPAEPPRWRFSGRSWAKPVPLRRGRPWT
jgi:hypothetical protein